MTPEWSENRACSCCIFRLRRQLKRNFVYQSVVPRSVSGRSLGVVTIVDLRLEPNNIADKLSLVSLVVAHFPCPVQQLDPLHPLVHSKLVFSGKIMDVSDQTAHHLPHPPGGLWTD